MPDVVDGAVENQKRNVELRTGRAFDSWVELARASGPEKHGELVAWLKSQHGMGHGDANRVALSARRAEEAPSGDGLVDAIYAGPKAALRPFHDRVVAAAQGFGDDVELAPKQAYVSLRRAKQFATVGPASGGRLEIGLNLKGMEPVGRREATTGMCTHRDGGSLFGPCPEDRRQLGRSQRRCVQRGAHCSEWRAGSQDAAVCARADRPHARFRTYEFTGGDRSNSRRDGNLATRDGSWACYGSAFGFVVKVTGSAGSPFAPSLPE